MSFYDNEYNSDILKDIIIIFISSVSIYDQKYNLDNLIYFTRKKLNHNTY